MKQMMVEMNDRVITEEGVKSKVIEQLKKEIFILESKVSSQLVKKEVKPTVHHQGTQFNLVFECTKVSNTLCIYVHIDIQIRWAALCCSTHIYDSERSNTTIIIIDMHKYKCLEAQRREHEQEALSNLQISKIKEEMVLSLKQNSSLQLSNELLTRELSDLRSRMKVMEQQVDASLTFDTHKKRCLALEGENVRLKEQYKALEITCNGLMNELEVTEKNVTEKNIALVNSLRLKISEFDQVRKKDTQCISDLQVSLVHIPFTKPHSPLLLRLQ